METSRFFKSLFVLFRKVQGYEGDIVFATPLNPQSGLRLDIPPDTPEPLAELMRECWAQNPEMRPSFPAIIQRLHQLYESLPE